jgi:hypothetical protein
MTSPAHPAQHPASHPPQHPDSPEAEIDSKPLSKRGRRQDAADETTSVSVRLERPVLEHIEKYAEGRGEDRSAVIREAIHAYFNPSQRVVDPLADCAHEVTGLRLATVKLLGLLMYQMQLPEQTQREIMEPLAPWLKNPD